MVRNTHGQAAQHGGDGGRGGHIILRGNAQLWTLLHLRYYKNVIAEDGENGSKNKCTGKDGKDIIIEVPLGTIARDEETGAIEAEILHDGQEIVWLKGGRGGLGGWLGGLWGFVCGVLGVFCARCLRVSRFCCVCLSGVGGLGACCCVFIMR